MKSLFVCLVLSFLLTIGVNATAQNAQQVGATAAKTTVKPAATAATPPQATPAVATNPTPAKAKKAAKSGQKAKSKGLFENDFDGEVGVKYIGTEPLPDEELGKVKDSKRVDEPAKKARKATAKPAANKKVSEVKADVQEGEAIKTEVVNSTPAPSEAAIVKTEEVKTTIKTAKPEAIKPATAAAAAPKPTPVKAVKTTLKAAEKPKMAAETVTETAKTAAKTVEVAKEMPKKAEKAETVKVVTETPKAVVETAKVVTETPKKVEPKIEVSEAKAEVKTSNPVVRAPETPKVEVVKAEAAPVIKTTAKSITKTSKPVVRGPRIEFEDMTINLGNIKEDAVLERYFEFTNTGGSNLEILECRGSCGCVQPKAMSTIVAPGERGQIYVKYTARNKVGPQKPVVTVTTNGSPSVVRLFVETWVEQIPGGVKDTTPTPTVPKSENN